jgi:spore germination protein KB
MREFVNFMLANVLNATPAYALLMVTGGVIVYAVSQGVIVIARVNLIVVLVTFLIFLVVTPFLVKHIDYHLLLPFADNPVLRIVQGSLAPIGWFSEVAVLLLMLPYLNNPSQASRIALWGVAACGSLLLLTVVITLAIYGPNFTAKLSYPTFSLIGIIDISKFLERIDILIISLWICSMYVKMSVFLFCTFHCFVHTFRIQLKMPILLAIGLFSVVASYFYWPKSTDMDYFQAYTLIPLLLAFNVLLPLLIWLCTSLMANKTVKGSS